MLNNKYKKSITAKEFLNNPSKHFHSNTYTQNEIDFDADELMAKYNLEPVDVAQLVNKIGYAFEASKKKDLLRLLKCRLDLLVNLEKNKIALSTNDERIANILIDIQDNHILEEKKQINAIISNLGIQVVTEEHRKNAIKESGPIRGKEIIFNAEHMVKHVGYGDMAVSVRLKNKFNSKMTYVDELLTLALFWIPRKGPIPKTNGNDFYLFCSDVLSTKNKKLTPENAFDKFKNNFVIEYSSLGGTS